VGPAAKLPIPDSQWEGNTFLGGTEIANVSMTQLSDPTDLKVMAKIKVMWGQ